MGCWPGGSARSVTGAAPLRVVLGNAPAVTLEVNGRPVSLAGLVRRRGDAHLLGRRRRAGVFAASDGRGD